MAAEEQEILKNQIAAIVQKESTDLYNACYKDVSDVIAWGTMTQQITEKVSEAVQKEVEALQQELQQYKEVAEELYSATKVSDLYYEEVVIPVQRKYEELTKQQR